jgi:ABC-type glycerol-3-phosphate transport system substrate-binding protein
MRKTITAAALTAALAAAGCGGSDPTDPPAPATTTQTETAAPEPTEPAAPDYELCSASEWDDPYEYADWLEDYIDRELVAEFRDAVDAYQDNPDDFGAELDLTGLTIDVRIACREVAAPPEN